MTKVIVIFLVVAFLPAGTVHPAAKKSGKAQPKSKATVTTVEKESPTQTIVVPQQEPISPQPPSDRELRDGEEVNWQVLSGGGGMRTIGDFILGSTIGQTAVGWSTVGDNKIHSGFWQDFGGGYCCENRGDVNHLPGPYGPVDVSDATYLIAMLWQGGPDPPCYNEGDVNALEGPSGPIDVADLTYLIAYLWQGGPEPSPCL